MVSSVGPYKFSTIELGTASDQACTEDTGRGSPQNKLTRSCGYWPGFRRPSCFIKTAVDGTENHIVRLLFFMKLSGLMSSFWDGQQTQAPRSHATNMSNAERSKVMSNICE